MKLHEAIIKTLNEKGNRLTSREIADYINQNKLYIREDNEAVPTSQINARIKNYSRFFIKEKSGHLNLYSLV